mgnify:CR=1 FL=1
MISAMAESQPSQMPDEAASALAGLMEAKVYDASLLFGE